MARIIGTSRNDILIGTSGKDVIVGMGGKDVIMGGGGDEIEPLAKPLASGEDRRRVEVAHLLVEQALLIASGILLLGRDR
ncbi:MAG: hypothetical protein ACRECX_00935 [Methyloceanibacter sp.]|uniref:hypothetical protein n=1 Tax=Methyloceanibacter sp. TaxID=1965321 RepID=UPI003D6D4BEF